MTELKKTVLDVITLEQLRELRAIGFVVVHQIPTDRMIKNSVRHEWPEQRSQEQNWHRMVGESIKQQNIDIAAMAAKDMTDDE